MLVDHCCFVFCRWHILRRPIIAEPSNVVVFVQAAVALHNYLVQLNPVCIALLGLLMGRMVKAAQSLAAGDQTKNHVWECNLYPTLAAIGVICST